MGEWKYDIMNGRIFRDPLGTVGRIFIGTMEKNMGSPISRNN